MLLYLHGRFAHGPSTTHGLCHSFYFYIKHAHRKTAMVCAIIGTTALLPIGNELKTPPKKFSDVHIFLTTLLTRPTGSSFQDRKSTRLNSSHVASSYAVFCLKKKKT